MGSTVGSIVKGPGDTSDHQNFGESGADFLSLSQLRIEEEEIRRGM